MAPPARTWPRSHSRSLSGGQVTGMLQHNWSSAQAVAAMQGAPADPPAARCCYCRGPLKPPFNDAARAKAGFGPQWYLPLAQGA
jgi:hypothetical protein